MAGLLFELFQPMFELLRSILGEHPSGIVDPTTMRWNL